MQRGHSSHMKSTFPSFRPGAMESQPPLRGDWSMVNFPADSTWPSALAGGILDTDLTPRAGPPGAAPGVDSYIPALMDTWDDNTSTQGTTIQQAISTDMSHGVVPGLCIQCSADPFALGQSGQDSSSVLGQSFNRCAGCGRRMYGSATQGSNEAFYPTSNQSGSLPSFDRNAPTVPEPTMHARAASDYGVYEDLPCGENNYAQGRVAFPDLDGSESPFWRGSISTPGSASSGSISLPRSLERSPHFMSLSPPAAVTTFAAANQVPAFNSSLLLDNTNLCAHPLPSSSHYPFTPSPPSSSGQRPRLGPELRGCPSRPRSDTRLMVHHSTDGYINRASDLPRSHSDPTGSTVNPSSQPGVVKTEVASDKIRGAAFERRRDKGAQARFACPLPGCGGTFTKKHNLDSHLRAHANERIYQCQYCFKSFVRINDCSRHERKHCKRRPSGA